MSELNEGPGAKYDRQRCRTCGRHWLPFKDEHGRIYAGHPYGETCSRYRPAEAGPVERPPAESGDAEATVVTNVNGSAH